MDSLKGFFLVAAPGLSDPNFSRSVVYLAEHNKEGAFGLVLNRPVDGANVWDVCQKIFDEPSELPGRERLESIPFYRGGPVQESAVFFLHDQVEHGEEEIPPGVYLGNQAETLWRVLVGLDQHGPERFRIFFGYSGWGAGQLERELRAGGWLVTEARLDQVFEPDIEGLWGKMLRSFGGDLGLFGYMPPNPDMN